MKNAPPPPMPRACHWVIGPPPTPVVVERAATPVAFNAFTATGNPVCMVGRPDRRAWQSAGKSWAASGGGSVDHGNGVDRPQWRWSTWCSCSAISCCNCVKFSGAFHHTDSSDSHSFIRLVKYRFQHPWPNLHTPTRLVCGEEQLLVWARATTIYYQDH